MSNEMIERVARAIQGELRRQGVLWEPDGEDLDRLMMGTGEVADMGAVTRAAIEAMREPTAEVLSIRFMNGDDQLPRVFNRDVWRKMIDAALLP